MNTDLGDLYERILRRFWQTLDSLGGGLESTASIEVFLALNYIRKADRGTWEELAKATSTADFVDYLRRTEILKRSAEDRLPLREILLGAGRERVPLQQLARVISELPLPPGSVVAADRFCQVLSGLEGGNSTFGDLMTPTSLVRCMVKLADVRPGQRVYDPFCRSGELLVGAAYEAMSSPGSAHLTLAGSTPTEHWRRVATLLTAMTDAITDIRWSDVLGPADDLAQAKYDVVVTNPPFNVRANSSRGWIGNWKYGQPPAHSGNYAWLQFVASTLAKDGRAVVVMPNSAGTSENVAEAGIRARMVEAGIVDCIVSLPAQLFRSVNVAVTIWVLRGPAHARDQVLFIDATRMGRMRSRAQRALSDVEIEKIVRQYRNWITNGRREVSRGIEGLARSVEIDRLAAHDYVLNPALYLDQLVQEPDEDRVLANVANLRRQLSALRGQVARGIFEDPLIDLDPAALQRAQPSAQQTWSRMHLADICDIMAGPGAVDRGSMQDAWIPIVLPRNIRSHQIVDENYDAVHPDVAMKLSRYRLREGDVITTRIGALGRNGVISSEQAGWLLGPGCIRLRPRDDVDGRFLAYYLSSPTARDWMERNAGGAAIKNISTKTLGRMPVALPPIDQQLTIGAVLSALDSDLITVQQIVSLTERLRDDLATLLLMGMPVRPRQY